MHANFWYVPAAVTLTELWCEVTAASATAGHTAALIVYACDANWAPSGAAVASGTVAIDSTGLKKVTGLSASLPAGRYVVVFWPQGACTTRVVQGAQAFLGSSAVNGTDYMTASVAYGAVPSAPAFSATHSDHEYCRVFVVVT
jgi:hypothetical protein